MVDPKSLFGPKKKYLFLALDPVEFYPFLQKLVY